MPNETKFNDIRDDNTILRDLSANSRQVGGDHYKVGGEEHWDRVARLKLDYFQGQITKYVERWRDKNGLQDLQKAAHFLQKYIELNTPQEPKNPFHGDGGLPHTDEGLSALVHGKEPRFMGVDPGAKDQTIIVIHGDSPMEHYSTAQFSMEGIKEGQVHYRCRYCRTHLWVRLDQRPREIHQCRSPAEAGAGYVNQDR